MLRRFGVVHIGFLFAVGLAGWLGLVAITVWPSGWFVPLRPSHELTSAFALMAVARLLSFRVFRRARVALDSAFYVAARFVFGTVAAGWLLILTLTVDAALRLWRGRGPVARGEAPLRHTVGFVILHGGLPALMLFATSALFGGDTPIEFTDDMTLLWQIPTFAVIFLGTHYFVAGGNEWFLGETSASLWREFFLRVVGAELTLVPLSLAMALAYMHQGIGLFLLLGATGLMFGGIFRRWTMVSETLQSRVDELQAINRIGRTIADSYDQQSLFKNLATASLQLVGEGSLFLIGQLDESGESVAYELYDSQGECLKSIVASPDDGLSGWVMSHKQGLCLGDLQREYAHYARDAKYNDERFHSWLGVPLVVYGEVVGVMSVQCERKHAYTHSQLRVLATIADQAAVAIENSRLYQLATVDGLTGLFVRRYFDQRLHEEWHRTLRYGNSFCLGLLDLDRFKLLNDTHGHQIGDQVLREAARVLRANMRSFDVAARYGGEEFAFILPRTTLQEGARVAERIRADIQRIAVEGTTSAVHITVSIGLAQCPTEGVDNENELLARSDEALYRAKSDGRNRVVLAQGAAALDPVALGEAGGTL